MRAALAVLMLLTGASACGDAAAPVPPSLSASPPALAFGSTALFGAARASLSVVSNTSARVQLFVRLRGTEDVQVAAAPAELRPGVPATVELVFSPSAIGGLVGTLELSTSEGTRLQVPLSGQSVPLLLQVQPAGVDFGPVLVGEAATATVTLRNRGAVPITVAAVTRDLQTSAEFSAPRFGRRVIAPGAVQTVAVTYAPEGPGRDDGRLVFVEPRADAPLYALRVLGEGWTQPISAHPRQLDFAGSVVGEARRRTLRITNTSGDVVQVAPPQFDAAAGQTGFEIAPAEGWPRAIEPGADFFIEVVYRPQRAEQLQSVLRLWVDEARPAVQVSLRAEARASTSVRAQVLPGEVVDFAEVPVGVPTRRPLVLTSVGLVPLTVARVGAVSAPFRVVRPLATPTTLEVGARHAFDVEVLPTAVGVHTATITVSSDDDERPERALRLVARAVEAPAPHAVPMGPVWLGAVERGHRAQGRLRLTGGAAATPIRAVRWRDDAGGRFSLGAVSPAQVPARAALDLPVSFFDPEGLPGAHLGRLELDLGGRLEEVQVFASTVPPNPRSWGLSVTMTASVAEVDLHVVREGGLPFDAPNDVTWCDPGPDWGVAGEPSDDPRWLSFEGGQRVSVNRPRASLYEVWVHNRSERAQAVGIRVDDTIGGIGGQGVTVAPGELMRVGDIDRARLRYVPVVVPGRTAEGRCF